MAFPQVAPANGEWQTRLRGNEAARRRSEGAPGMSSPQVLVYGVARTPFGKFYGDLSGYPAAELGAIALNEVMLRSALPARSEEHTSELQSVMRISNSVFCWKKKK